MKWQKLLSNRRAGSKSGSLLAQRSDFEIDFDRIIFSLPFRKMQDKTQVFPLPEDDFVHNRLTHSLEVASVGRSLGKLAGDQILAKNKELAQQNSASDFSAIVSAAALTHDVGNPPFGHTGEKAISDFFKKQLVQNELKSFLNDAQWADLVDFEGNAQGFRLLNQSQHGLKLTMATLGAFTKYPRQSMVEKPFPEKASQKKFGFYQSEKETFEHLAESLELIPQANSGQWSRHPLAFLVEAADDICYHIIDLEDGCTLGLVSFEETVDLLKPIIREKFDAQKLSGKQSQHEKLGILRAIAINQLINEVVEVFASYESQLLDSSFDKPITSQIESTKALKEIQDVSIERIYRAKIVLEKEIAGFEVIEGLLSTLITAAFNYTFNKTNSKDKTLLRLLPEEVTPYLQHDNLYLNIRIMLDYISGMTDSHALTMYRKLKGMSLPSW